jgi:hypothetical protein
MSWVSQINKINDLRATFWDTEDTLLTVGLFKSLIIKETPKTYPVSC